MKHAAAEPSEANERIKKSRLRLENENERRGCFLSPTSSPPPPDAVCGVQRGREASSGQYSHVLASSTASYHRPRRRRRRRLCPLLSYFLLAPRFLSVQRLSGIEQMDACL
jgi:hypothetical protein